MSPAERFTFGNTVVDLRAGDCMVVLKGLPDNSVDSCVTDPPYHLTSIVKRFGAANAAPAKHGAKENATGAFVRSSKGFMGKTWEGGDIAQNPELWAEVFRVLKPGAHVAAFSSTRTYHRMAVAIEDAGFEIRDQLAWCYGTGFPKSHAVEVEGFTGFGTALKPAWEPICLGRKPLSEKTVAGNVLAHVTGAINVDGCRVETSADDSVFAKSPHTVNKGSNKIYGGFSKEGSEVYDPTKGRFPAHLIHDGSDEVLTNFPSTKPAKAGKPRQGKNGEGWGMTSTGAEYDDAGASAARFFYCAKASKEDRVDSKHPTVKPVALMRWLARLITPPGGVVLDPFAGTGTTGHACVLEQFSATLIEREAEYLLDIQQRIGGLQTDYILGDLVPGVS